MNGQKLVAIGIKRSGDVTWQLYKEQELLKKETVEAFIEDDPTFIERAEADLDKQKNGGINEHTKADK